MIIKSFYDALALSEDVKGQEFHEPSITEPDRATSIKMLIAKYSQGQLPALSELQPYLDAPDVPSDDLDLDDSKDLRVADKADLLEKFLEANNIRRSIFEKVKAQHKWNKQQQEKELQQYRDKYGKIDL